MQFFVYSREPVCFVTIPYISCKVTKNFFPITIESKALNRRIEGCSVSKITIPLFTLHVSPICGVVTFLFLFLCLSSPPSSVFLYLPLFCSLRQNFTSGCHVMVVFHKFPQSGSLTDLYTAWHVLESKG